ncbi:glutathionine S-transferase [Candidatus Terasakiella magnetica]|nr:glutathionine S-transferase [Candidatus Terasakiella magnetica]
MKLYYKAGACSLSPHIALREAGIAFEMEAVDLPTKKTETGIDFLTINPKGYIPALVLDDGTVLTEGVSIVLYIASLVPEKKLAPAAGSMGYAKLVEWLIFIATEMHKSAGGLFNPAFPDEAKTVIKGLLTRRLDFADKALGAGPFLMGETFTVADGYLFTVLLWLPRLGIELAPWPHLAAFFARVLQRPTVQAAMTAEKLI